MFCVDILTKKWNENVNIFNIQNDAIALFYKIIIHKT